MSARTSVDIPTLVRNRALAQGAGAWLDALPELVARLEADWRIEVGRSYDEGSEGLVCEATRAGGTPAVLKLLAHTDAVRNEATIELDAMVDALHCVPDGVVAISRAFRGATTLLAYARRGGAWRETLREELGGGLLASQLAGDWLVVAREKGVAVEELAVEVSAASPEVGHLTDRLVAEVHRLDGDDAVALAVKAMTAGQALSRIDDHASVLGARLRYLFTGDPDHLAAEVR